ncbi:GMC oxidoreductase [Microbacterium sp. M1A1_1b]
MTGPQPLATAELPESCGIAVIGSGFGASVAAARLAAAAGNDVVVLERGREWVPGDFPTDVTSMRQALRTRSNPLGLFDLQLGTDVDRLTANGLGGGSLVYANVLLEARPEVFDTVWPTSIDADVLRPYADRVRAVLRPEQFTGPSDKAAPLDRLGRLHGRTPRRLPLAVKITGAPGPNAAGVHQAPCTACGNCVTGCNVGAKTTMWASYLPMAKRAGARLVTATEVLRIEPGPPGGRRWTLHGIRHGVRGRRRTTRPFTLHADVVVLGAGSVGTTTILLRSARAGLPLSDRLGERFSGNADSLSVSYNSTSRRTGTGARDQSAPELAVGPTITTALDLRDGADGHLVQDGALPYPVAEALRRVLGLRFALSSDAKVWCDLRPNGCPPGCGALEHSQVWLAMGTDSSAGRIGLDPRGAARITWAAAGEQDVYRDQLADLRALSEGSEARFVGNPRRALLRRGVPAATPITVHPLGGAVMADDVRAGVCDADGRVFDPAGDVHQGLYVVDGALCPTSTGANPSLTIAALAERISERLVERHLAIATAGHDRATGQR